MSRFGISRPSPAMAVALVALFVALGGGSYAAVQLSDGGATARAGVAKSGAKMKGVYRVSDFESAAGQGQFADEAINYPQRLKSAPTPHFIAEGGTPPAVCPGTPQSPKAQKGHLCVYENNTGQRDPGDVLVSYGDARAKLGFIVSVLSAANQGGFYFSEGSWAVTAP